jgi:hypothetical protein
MSHTPSLSVSVRLASLAIHIDEFLSPHGHPFDKDAISTLLNDAEVRAYLAEMDKAGFLPKKRN